MAATEVPEDLVVGMTYSVELATEDGEFFAESEVEFVALDPSSQVVSFGDLGYRKDDSLRLILRDPLDNFITDFRLPKGQRYVESVTFDNAKLEAEGGAPVTRVDVECLDPGDDEECTYGISIQNATLDLLSEPGNEGLVSDSSKIDPDTNDTVRYGVNPLLP